MNLSLLPLPVLVIISIAAIISGLVLLRKSWGKEKNFYSVGVLIGALGLVGETIVELEGKFATFGIGEIVSGLVIFIGIVFMALGRYTRIRKDSSKRKRFLILIGIAAVCFGSALCIGIIGYFRK